MGKMTVYPLTVRYSLSIMLRQMALLAPNESAAQINLHYTHDTAHKARASCIQRNPCQLHFSSPSHNWPRTERGADLSPGNTCTPYPLPVHPHLLFIAVRGCQYIHSDCLPACHTMFSFFVHCRMHFGQM